MKHLKYFSMNESLSPKVIEFDIKNDNGEVVGNVSGIIHYDKNYLNNWMNTNGIYPDTQKEVWNKIQMPVAILKNINVEEDFKNQGFGNQGLEEFLLETEEADYVLLIADGGESNDFNLERWYKKNGFEVIGGTIDFPLMLLERNK